MNNFVIDKIISNIKDRKGKMSEDNLHRSYLNLTLPLIDIDISNQICLVCNEIITLNPSCPNIHTQEQKRLYNKKMAKERSRKKNMTKLYWEIMFDKISKDLKDSGYDSEPTYAHPA